MKYLGIDYGTKKVGVAISDDTGTLAFPKAVLRHSHTLIGEIRDTIKTHTVEAIVVGQSLNTDGSENFIMDDIKRFVALLEKETNIPVYLQPEFFTSSEARREGSTQIMIDASAAALILQRFLDKQGKRS